MPLCPSQYSSTFPETTDKDENAALRNKVEDRFDKTTGTVDRTTGDELEEVITVNCISNIGSLP